LKLSKKNRWDIAFLCKKFQMLFLKKLESPVDEIPPGFFVPVRDKQLCGMCQTYGVIKA
jgi:hypothetical protein